MRILSIIVIYIFFFSFQAVAQVDKKESNWDILLKDVKVSHVYSFKYNGYVPKPKFGAKVKSLEGARITLQGYFLPYNETGDTCVVSFLPMDMCFFCTGKGVQTLVEGVVNKKHVSKFGDLKTDDVVRITGILRLNEKDVEHLIYILDDVKLIKIVK